VFGREHADTARALPGDPYAARSIVVGGGIALAMARLDHVLFNRAIGMGLDEPLSEGQVETVARFYDDLGTQLPVIQLAPAVATPDAVAWLAAHGYHPSRNWVKLWHDLRELPAARTDLRIEPIGPERADDFVRITIDAFELGADADALVRALIGRTGWNHYLGYDGDDAVSIAALYVTEGVARLGYGGTLEAARGRGGQSAMFSRRLRDARDVGCRFAVTETSEETEENPVNHSYRNMLRAGFQLAYARRNYVRTAAPA
jgi:hypothetical protein